MPGLVTRRGYDNGHPTVAVPILTPRALNRAALSRQLLLARQRLEPIAAIERLGAMQAQMPRPPFVGLWSRIAGFTRADLIRAIEKRDVVRATMMRATIHLVSRRDFLAWRTPLQPMLTRTMRSLFDNQLDVVDLPALLDAARRRFETEPCTFASLRAHLKARFPSLDERAMGYIVRMQVPLVQTPMPGAEWAYPATASFTVADGWLDEAPASDPSIAPLVLRYLAAFGPASVRDFQVWSGMQGGRDAFDALRKKLVVFTDDQGRELFDLPKAPRPAEDEPAPVRLLPEYDSLLLAYDDRRRIVASEHRRHVITRNLMIPATFLVDGVVAGTWKAERQRKTARLVMAPFATLDRSARQALSAEAEAALEFIAPDVQNRAVQFS